ncbi:DoxX-like family protein [Pseudoalteromonas rubra]|nr:DoxX-like family protein [Pseudoalteromonas rubra]
MCLQTTLNFGTNTYTRHYIYMNIIALVGLLLAVAVLQPVILFEAFNPLTTNLPLIVLSALLLPKVPFKKDNFS